MSRLSCADRIHSLGSSHLHLLNGLPCDWVCAAASALDLIIASRAEPSETMRLCGSVLALLAATVAAEPIPRAVKAPTVDLGYAVYEGSYDGNNSINAFKGYVTSRVIAVEAAC